MIFARVAEAYDVLSDGANHHQQTKMQNPVFQNRPPIQSNPHSVTSTRQGTHPPYTRLTSTPLCVLIVFPGKLKATFDLLGEGGLKQGVPDGKGGKKAGASTRPLFGST